MVTLTTWCRYFASDQATSRGV